MLEHMKMILALGVITGLAGCSTVKWTQPDRVTGGTWMIKQNPLASDTIYYCPPPRSGQVSCLEARSTW